MSHPEADSYAADRLVSQPRPARGGAAGPRCCAGCGAARLRPWPALAVVAANSILIVAISGAAHRRHRRPARPAPRSFVLGLLALVLPVAALAGWLVSQDRVAGRGGRIAATVAVAVIVLGAV